MASIFDKLNLSNHETLVVLSSPQSFEDALGRAEGREDLA